jgi:O-antigen/teichoic acid export membrane protein
MDKTLKEHALSGAKWSSITQFGKYGISFFLSIILARLLAPEEFGLIGMLTIFTTIANVFINSGLSSAIIRLKDASENDYSTVFYFNMVVSLFFYGVLFFSAPLIASFYDEALLVSLTRWISLVFVINAFGIIQNAILIKAINFKVQTICILSGLGVSVIVSAYMAFSGYGVWSIVGQVLSQALVTNILLWLLSKWAPSGRFNIESFKKLWAFSSKILLTSIITQVINNIDSILIGKVFSASQLGFYTRAKSTQEIPVSIGSSTLSYVSFSILSKVNDNATEFEKVHIKLFKLSAYVFLPIIFGLIAVAEPFVIVLYSAKWIPSVQLLQIISLYGIGYFFGTLFSQTIMALGKSNVYLKLNMSKKILGLLAIPFGIYAGIYAFVWSLVILSFVGIVLDFYFTGKLLSISIGHYIKRLISPLLISILMSGLVYSVSFTSLNNNILLLSVQVFAGVIAYSTLSVLFKVPEFYYIKDILTERIRKFIK